MKSSWETEIVDLASHHVYKAIKVIKSEPKENDSEFESYVFWISSHNSNDSKELV